MKVAILTGLSAANALISVVAQGLSDAELGLGLHMPMARSRSSIGGMKTEKRDSLAKRDPFARWCGKHYNLGSPADSEEVQAGFFARPSTSDESLLDFRCTPAVQPYLSGETEGAFIIDANITHDVGVQFTSSSNDTSSDTLNVMVQVTNSSTTLISNLTIPVGSTGTVIPVSLSSVPTSASPYTISCSATLGSDATQSFTASSTLYNLPANPYIANATNTTSVATKIDRRSGAMLRVDKESGEWKPFMPFGFYTGYSDVIANLSIIDQMAADGFNVIHFVPPYDNVSEMEMVLDHADAAGIMYVADFRDIYENLTAVEPYVELFRTRENFLTWYTNDEPDGTADPSNYTAAAYELFYEMDGYHPVSLVLNCLDFFWTNYTSGSDIVFADVYPIAVNTTFSQRYGTVCNLTYGDCGCDDCQGEPTDISHKLDLWSEFRRFVGRTRTLPIWNVPQAFNGTDEFWTRVPTGAEFKMQSVLGANHGAVGIMPWDNPYDTPSIAEGAREIAPVFSSLSSPVVALILSANATRTPLTATNENETSVDIARWVIPGTSFTEDGGVVEGGNMTTTVVLMTSLLYENSTVEVDATQDGLDGNLTLVSTVFKSAEEANAQVQNGAITITLESTGVAGFIFLSS